MLLKGNIKEKMNESEKLAKNQRVEKAVGHEVNVDGEYILWAWKTPLKLTKGELEKWLILVNLKISGKWDKPKLKTDSVMIFSSLFKK